MAIIEGKHNGHSYVAIIKGTIIPFYEEMVMMLANPIKGMRNLGSIVSDVGIVRYNYGHVEVFQEGEIKVCVYVNNVIVYETIESNTYSLYVEKDDKVRAVVASKENVGYLECMDMHESIPCDKTAKWSCAWIMYHLEYGNDKEKQMAANMACVLAGFAGDRIRSDVFAKGTYGESIPYAILESAETESNIRDEIETRTAMVHALKFMVHLDIGNVWMERVNALQIGLNVKEPWEKYLEYASTSLRNELNDYRR